MERFFQPHRAHFLKHRNAGSRGLYVISKDLTNIHHQERFFAETFPRCLKMIIVGL